MEPSQRLTCGELLTHAYFDDYEPIKAPAVNEPVKAPTVKARKTKVSEMGIQVCNT